MADIHVVDPPVEKTIVRIISGFSIMNVSVVPFECAVIPTKLFDLSGTVIINKTFTMGGIDYANWNNDDQYLYDWIETQIQQMSG